MTPAEKVALAWAAKYLKTHACHMCGKKWLTAASVAVLMHRCNPPRKQRRVFDMPDPYLGTTPEEARASAWRILQGPRFEEEEK